MGMRDCIKCWDYPCTCGYEYRNWTPEERAKAASAELGVPWEEILKFLNERAAK